jgi:hypothetical protein
MKLILFLFISSVTFSQKTSRVESYIIDVGNTYKKYRLIEYHNYDRGCLDSSNLILSSKDSRNMINDLNNFSKIKGDYISFFEKKCFKFNLKNISNKPNNLVEGIVEENDFIFSDGLTLFKIALYEDFLFMSSGLGKLDVYVNEEIKNPRLLSNKELLDAFRRIAKKENKDIEYCIFR